jgi:phosphoenolpyruvate-protein kinase (PTS system EI component)
MVNELKLALDREIPDPCIIEQVAGVGMVKSEKTGNPEYITIPTRMEENQSYLSTVCDLFKTKPVWYRTDDTPTYRANKLKGTEKVIEEENPLMGLRGMRRSLHFVDTFRRELEMFLNVQAQHDNLNLLLPVIHDKQQVVQAQEILKDYNYKGRLGIMLEIPSAVLTVNEFIDLGVDYFMVGMNDLTSFTQGISRRDISVKDSIIYEHNSISFLLNHLKKYHTKEIEIVIGGEVADHLDFYKTFKFNAIAVPYKDIHKALEVEKITALSSAGV